MSNNLGLNPFPDLICHFLAPWWPFWVSRLLIGQNPECSDQKTYLAKVTRNAQLDPFPDLSPRRSARIQKPILRKLTGAPKNLGVDTFPDSVGNFGAPWRPFWISRPLIGRNPECSDQKTYFAKVTRNALSRPRQPFCGPWRPFWILRVTFSHRRSVRIKRLIYQKLMGAPKT